MVSDKVTFIAPAFRSSVRNEAHYLCGRRGTAVMCACKKVTFVTGNANKLREVRQILSSSGVTNLDLVSEKIDLPELQGTIDSVARAKCAEAARRMRGPVLVEDTALVCGDLLACRR